MYLSWLLHVPPIQFEVWSLNHSRGRGVWISRHGQSGRAHGLGSFMSLDEIADDALGVLKSGIRAIRVSKHLEVLHVLMVQECFGCELQFSGFSLFVKYFDILTVWRFQYVYKFWIFSVHSNWPGMTTSKDNFNPGREYCTITTIGRKHTVSNPFCSPFCSLWKGICRCASIRFPQFQEQGSG